MVISYMHRIPNLFHITQKLLSMPFVAIIDYFIVLLFIFEIFNEILVIFHLKSFLREKFHALKLL